MSGLLLALALPPAGWAPLGWLCWVPVFLATRGRGVAFGFAGGIFSCLVAAAISESGLIYGTRLSGAPNGWTYAGCAIFGLAASVTGVGVGVSESLTPRRIAGITGLAVLAEAALLIYLPAHLALTQSQNPVVLGLTMLGGIWLASGVVWAGNLAITGLLQGGKFGPALIIAAGLAGTGFLSRFVWPETGPLKIGVVQTLSGDPDTLRKLNLQAGQAGAELVVWPELAGTSLAPGGDPARLREIASEPGQPPFITSFPDGASPKPFNTAVLFAPGLAEVPYRKRKPFAAERQIHQAGTEPVVVEFKGTRYGLAICFDSCFPAVMRDLATRPSEAQVILLPTLDPETPHGFAAAVHAAYSSFRAAELGIPIVRADIVGWSHAVDANGRLIGQMGLEADAATVYGIQPANRPRPARFIGEWILLVFAGLAIYGFWPARRTPKSEPSD